MATSTEDLLRIHHRYPVLAFLLSLCNPSTILSGLTSPPHPNRVLAARRRLNTQRSQSYQHMKTALSITLPFSDATIGMTDFLHDAILHILGAGIATMMIYQALLLGMRGVIVFACWTWHEPFTWVGVGGLIHLLSAIAWRLCLGPRLKLSEPETNYEMALESLTLPWMFDIKVSESCAIYGSLLSGRRLDELRVWYRDVERNELGKSKEWIDHILPHGVCGCLL